MNQFVTATRNELKRKKDSLVLAMRGHDMLKDKKEELTKIYFDLINKTYAYKKKCRHNLLSTLDNFSLASAFQSSQEVLREFLMSADIFSLQFGENFIGGYNVPSVQINTDNISDFPYAFASTNILFDDIIDDMKSQFLSLVNLSALEQTCHILSKKIQSLKMRVNYLELHKIPNLKKEIAYINLKLEENNTYNTLRLIKAKEIRKN